MIGIVTPKAGPSPSTPNLECFDLSELLDLSDGSLSEKIKQCKSLSIKPSRHARKNRLMIGIVTPKAGPSPSTPNLECSDLSIGLGLSCFQQ